MGEGEGGMFQENSIETCILSRVKQFTGPGWRHETSARTWCSGRTWRERVGREVGGGIRMGKTCEPKAFSFQCMSKFTTNKKKKDTAQFPMLLRKSLLFSCFKRSSAHQVPLTLIHPSLPSLLVAISLCLWVCFSFANQLIGASF